MAILRIGKKLLRIIWITAGSLILLVVAFHFWVVYYAEEIIQDLVSAKSNGKLALEVKNFKFNWFSRKMELQDAVFYSTDSINAGTTYRFAVKKIKLKVKAVWPVIFEKSVLINELELRNPDITVTRLRPSKDKARSDNVSVPQEMGRIYNSIQDALQVLRVKKFQFEDGSFKLINKIQPDQQPFYISHIDLTIHDLKVDTAKLTGKEKLFFSDNVVLKSRNQDILFPDKRHKLAFQKFRINIEKKLVEFDSCTIAAIKTENSSTGFSIFFDKLVMTDIDFYTLYHSEVIKADSVYCINPVFKLTADLDKRKSSNRPAPKLDEIIRRLTGEMMVNFVVVNNASFDINTVRGGNPSSFRSHHNNFEMQGLSIDDDEARPFRVEKFAMAIRNYENFLKDSLYALQFDSIHVNNDKIFLNNFSFQKLNNGKPVNNFFVPRFQLTGLSWDDLLFERKLTAQGATLYNPVIDYTASPKKVTVKKKRTIFDVLGNINDVLMLENMNIINGDIHVQLHSGTDMRMNKATLSVQSRALLGSEQFSGIRRSVNYLDFSKGILQINDLTVSLDSINYTGVASRLNAKAVRLSNSSGTINARAHHVAMNEIFINEFTGDVSIGGINWQEADIDLTKSIAPKVKKKGGASFISLTDIIGFNTRIRSLSGDKKISALVGKVAATAILLKPGELPLIAGLDISGKDFLMTRTGSQLAVSAFDITDLQKAKLENIRYKKQAISDSTDISVEKLSFVPNLQKAVEGGIKATDMKITRPVFNIHSGLKETATAPAKFSLPKGTLDKLVIEEPFINFSKQTEKGTWKLHWDGRNNKTQPLIITNITSDGLSISADQLDLLLSNFIYETAKGKKINSGTAEVNAQLNDLTVERGQDKYWQATVTKLEGKDFIFDSLGKKNGKLAITSWRLKDALLRSSAIKDLRSLSAENKKVKVEQVTGSYVNTDDRFEWFNAAYDKSSRFFSLDSFSYNPVQDKEAFIKKKQFQADYFRIKTGSAVIGAFDIDSYFADSIVRIDKMLVNDVVFNDFRDKRPPFRSGIIKPLLTNRIKTIPFKLSVDSVVLNNAYVTYAELNAQTKQTGVIPISRMNLLLFPVRNYDLSLTDSLRLQANAYLMDSALVRIRMGESYADSLSGFLLTVRIDEADLRVLNPVLMPISSVKLRSGVLDSLVMRVNADEYYAYGEIDMHYHDLKIRILRMADQKGGKFKNAMLNFLANSVVIKNKNTKRTGLVFFVRNRDRSSLNYLVKMLMSGVNSSIGVKSTRKNFKPYKKQLRQRNLPPADYD